MSAYEFWDEDVEKITSHASIGNVDIYEIGFKEPIEAVNIHKNDVIHLANLFGLAVYEKEAAL